MNPERCPRFNQCSAPICPLDSDWRKRRHIDGEPVCAYLLEAARNNGRPPQTPDVTGEMTETLALAYPEIESSCGSIRRALRRASKAGPRLGRKPNVSAAD